MPISEKESRIRAITKLYYSKPEVQKAIFEFAKSREVVPRYFEGFGKRPDALQYPSDIMGLVNKGATSFHCSEEIWRNPLELDTNSTQDQLTDLRTGWDLLIDIDSPFLDYSKIAAKLLIQALEKEGVSSYGIKFSGSKGFHIIVPWKAFPLSFEGQETKKMFPEWPRAICEYLMKEIRQNYNKEISKLGVNFKAVQERMNLSKSEIVEMRCPNQECTGSVKKAQLVTLVCNKCGNTLVRPKFKPTARKMRCINVCPGTYEISNTKDYFYCELCGFNSLDKRTTSENKVTYSNDLKKAQNFSSEFKEEVMAEKMASLDLVLVASRHLFRMPYSLHEKTSLASAVISKSEIENFSPQDANPLKIKIREFYPEARPDEARGLLHNALSFKSKINEKEKVEKEKKYREYEDFKGEVTEDMFPKPIKKLLLGLKDGRKRGLFVLLTFLRSLNFPNEYIEKKVYEWNKLNDPSLKDGYVKSQLDWHFKQSKKILPPNYSNNSFYKDLGLVNDLPKEKNPIVEVMKLARKRQS